MIRQYCLKAILLAMMFLAWGHVSARPDGLIVEPEEFYRVPWRDTVYYRIPIVRAVSQKYEVVADSINRHIQVELSLDGYEDRQKWSEWCLSSNYSYVMDDDVFYIFLKNEFLGNRGSFEDFRDLFFDSRTGKLLGNEMSRYCYARFSDLFTLKGYFEFLRKRKWRMKMHEAFKESCELYYRDEAEIDSSEVDSSEMITQIDHFREYQFLITYDVVYQEPYFYYERDKDDSFMDVWHSAYEPICADECPMDSVLPYLNRSARKMLLENSKIKRFLRYGRFEKKLAKKRNEFIEIKYHVGKDTLDVFWQYQTVQLAIERSPKSSKIKGYLFTEIDGERGLYKDGIPYGGAVEKVRGEYENGVYRLTSTHTKRRYEFSEEEVVASSWPSDE